MSGQSGNRITATPVIDALRIQWRNLFGCNVERHVRQLFSAAARPGCYSGADLFRGRRPSLLRIRRRRKQLGRQLIFDPAQYKDRAALLLVIGLSIPPGRPIVITAIRRGIIGFDAAT